MTGPTEPRPERSGPEEEDTDDARRRRDTAAEIVAEGMLALLLRERQREREASDSRAKSAEEEHVETSGGRVRVAGRGERSAVSTSRAESLATR